MKMPKKTNSFIAFLLFATTFNSYSMKNPQEVTSIPTEAIANILLGSAELTPDKLPLPPETQYQIINLLFTTIHANTITIAGQTINTLAQINYELNALINNPQFCYELIKYLSKKFDCSDETTCMALQTQEAQKRLQIQKLFEMLLREELFNKKEFNNFYQQYKATVDLNFTYKYYPDLDFKNSLLICATKTNINKAAKIAWLLNTKNINVNYANKFGITALMECAITADHNTLRLLCNYPTININQKNNNGDTALMMLCKYSPTAQFNRQNLRVLVNAGADPDIANNKGLTPLQAVNNGNNQNAIDLITEAIDTKHNIRINHDHTSPKLRKTKNNNKK